MRTFMPLLGCLVLLTTAEVAAEREWQSGIWRDATVERPRVTVGIVTGDPNNRTPQAASAREIRKYMIENGTHRFELRQDATANTPRVDAEIGEPVTFAVEKKNVYVKDVKGREHRLTLTKQTRIAK
jgi:hypothetical protein